MTESIMELYLLQQYWWLLISILGAALVFLLFVQGGQSLLFGTSGAESRRLMINSLGRKWEFTYTTLVVFGGAFFAAFPLFYSTSFGGAYWLWMLILLSFVVQAVSYEFRSKPGNIYTHRTYDALLMFNGLVGCVLLGVAVGIMFFGGDFTVNKTDLVATGATTVPVISQWGAGHGLEAIADWRCLLLGFTVFFLARAQGALYFINNIDDARGFGISNRIRVLFNGCIFAVLFIGFLAVLLTSSGARQTADGTFIHESNIYLHNLLDMWWCMPVLAIGAIAVLYGIFKSAFSTRWRYGIWFSGVGTVLVVMVLFWLAGYNATAFYPSNTSIGSSLSITNSSSTEFTLKVMSYASLVIPVVLFYIIYVWRKMNKEPLTPAELDSDSHSY